MLSNEVLFEEPKIELVAYLQGKKVGKRDKETGKILYYNKLGPDEVAAYAASGDKNREPMYKLWKSDASRLSRNRIKKITNKILDESYRRGHGSVGDLGYFVLSIEDLTRAATIGLTGPEYLNHEQQSMRFVTADRGYFVPKALREPEFFDYLKDVLNDSFSIYDIMVKNEIPVQDARFVLPLLSKTNITTEGNVRELQHLESIYERNEAPSYVKSVVKGIIKKAEEVAPLSFEKTKANTEPLSWSPSTDIYGSENKTIERLIEEFGENISLINGSSIPMKEEEIKRAILDKEESYLANLKHNHYTFLVPLSLSGNHQLRRQRRLHLSDQSIFDAAKKEDIQIPPSIKASEFIQDYIDINQRMLGLYNNLVEVGIERSEAIGVIPHSTKIRTLIDVDGHNAIHFIGKRRCTTAQWEIRNLADEISKIIEEKNPALGKFAVPQCGTYGYCPEKEPCGLEKKFKIT